MEYVVEHSVWGGIVVVFFLHLSNWVLGSHHGDCARKMHD